MESTDEASATRIVQYIVSNQLVYGSDIARPSWAIPLAVVELPTETVSAFVTLGEHLVGEYVMHSAALIESAVDDTNGDTSLLVRVADEAITSLWRSAWKRLETRLPFCVRADFALRSDGGISVVEFNVD